MNKAARPIRLLVFEADSGATGSFSAQLQALPPAGMEIVGTVQNVDDALHQLKSNPADATLFVLSGMDALPDLARLAGGFSGVPIVAIGNGGDDLEAAALLHGARQFIERADVASKWLRHVVCAAIDVAAAHRTTAEEHNLLTALLTHIGDRVYFKDRESRFIRVNSAMAELFKVSSPEEIIGKTDHDFFSHEHAEVARRDEERILETGRAMMNSVERITFDDGRVGWALTTKAPLRNLAGAVIGTCGISKDITAIKEMEDALAGERNLLRSVIDNLPDRIYVKDVDGRYILDNVAHARFVGCKNQSEVEGKTVFDFFDAEQAERFQREDLRIVESGEALLNHERVDTSPEGKKAWALTTKVPLRDEMGHLFGVVAITRDITDHKLAEEHMSRINADLFAALSELKEAHSQLRTVQLELIEAEKMKSIGRLATGVAHEVKNPLAIITMGIDFLRQQNMYDETVEGVLAEMNDAILRADSVIKGLLDFSAPKNLELVATDLNAVIEQSLLLVRGEMSGPQFHVERELATDLPLIPIDRVKISQVFINLFTNAIHAMPEGGILTVRTYPRQLMAFGSNIGDERSETFRAGEQVVVAEIEDTGIGIPLDKLTKVYDPFFTTKPTGKGTGLGLTVTKNIVDLHGGTLELANRSTGGAKVTITLRT